MKKWKRRRSWERRTRWKIERTSCGMEMLAYRTAVSLSQRRSSVSTDQHSVFALRTRLSFHSFRRTKTLWRFSSCERCLYVRLSKAVPVVVVVVVVLLSSTNSYLSRDYYSITSYLKPEGTWNWRDYLAVYELLVTADTTERNFSSACISQRVYWNNQNTELHYIKLMLFICVLYWIVSENTTVNFKLNFVIYLRI